jgi:hypothetical protein
VIASTVVTYVTNANRTEGVKRMPDERKEEPREIVITGSKIKSVEINNTTMQLKQGSDSTTWIVTLPNKDKLSDGPWPVVVVLPDETRREFNYKYRKKQEGKSQIIIVTARQPHGKSRAATAG